MQIIPVIDIRNGVAVRAVAGRRADYQPLETPWSKTSDPRDVARGLMSLYPFGALYIADLDAIERRGANGEMTAVIAETIAPARLWLDAGCRGDAPADLEAMVANKDIVLGSESLESVDEAAQAIDRSRVILSLDFSDAGFLGDPRLLSDTTLWPDRVIVMTLARVGAGQGPDLTRLREIARRAPGRRIYAAGGVRGLDDLMALRDAGAAGALVATALHERRLTPDDLATLGAK
ncbi:HisA/HisF-related TIM barrel protein [Methylocystis echinoides]|jgi:HisA/HisF family protein|uniref:HisA/HisF-related TIM barrel protein n=1 Tax=Methylocystis echinoides TaxID=29468 RepID=UPI00341F745F